MPGVRRDGRAIRGRLFIAPGLAVSPGGWARLWNRSRGTAPIGSPPLIRPGFTRSSNYGSVHYSVSAERTYNATSQPSPLAAIHCCSSQNAGRCVLVGSP